MMSNKKIARVAGLVYLVVVLAGMFSLMYVPSKLIVLADAKLTVDNIIAHEFLYRLGLVSGLVCYTFFLVLPLILYRLLSHVDKTHAILMVVLAVISVPISFISILYKFNVLNFISDAEYLRAFSPEQLQAQVMLSLKSYQNGILIASIFWGLWLFPFGYLVFKSGILPKFFGIFLMLGSVGYIIGFLGHALSPIYGETLFASVVSIPSAIGEIGICLWLLIMGAKEKPIGTQVSYTSKV